LENPRPIADLPTACRDSSILAPFKFSAPFPAYLVQTAAVRQNRKVPGSARLRLEYAVYPSDTSKRYTLARYRTDDVYANPGTIVMMRGGGGDGGGRGGFAGPGGALVQLSADKENVFFQGTVNDKNLQEVGPRTFLDRVAIKTGEKKRIYESDNTNAFERIPTVIDPEARRIKRPRPTVRKVASGFSPDQEGGGARKRSALSTRRSLPRDS
jgi:hypothetical protein